MGNFRRFLILLCGCMLVTCILTPWIYLGVQAAAQTWDTVWLWKTLAKYPFHRYFNRVFQISIVLGVWPLLKSSGFFSLEALGLKASRPFSPLAIGIISSIVCLASYALFCEWMGWYSLKDQLSKPASVLFLKIGTTALLVSVMEELFFRGYLYKISRKELGHTLAVFFNITFFAVIHYMKPKTPHAFTVIDWSSGFRMFGFAFEQFAHFPEIMGGILVLMALAWICCWTVDRTGNIYLAIGIHIGAIVVVQWSSELLRYSSSLPTWLLGGGDLSQGALVVVAFSMVFLLLSVWLKGTGFCRERP